MPIIEYNTPWMLFNIFLAILPVIFGYLFLKIQSNLFKVLIGVLWLLFLPNTIYLFTDLLHVIYQWGRVDQSERLLLILQYVVLEIVGFVTFILAFRPFEKLLEIWKVHKKNRVFFIIAFNFLIAFGLVLGRIERINSWEVVTAPYKVIEAAIMTLTTPEHLGLTILFGLLCNFSYFLLRDPIKKII